MKAKFALAVCAVALIAVPASASADNPALTGDVGLNDTSAISLVDAFGKNVTHLGTGTYTLTVHEHSVHHNFHLYGPRRRRRYGLRSEERRDLHANARRRDIYVHLRPASGPG